MDTNQININDYISNQALDAIYYLEGHYKGAEKPTSYKGKKDAVTTYYGMTENGLKTIRASKLPLPEFMKTATVQNLTKEQAREAAGLLAAAHTVALDRAFGDNKTFSQLPLAWRSAVLTLAHSNGVNGWIDSYKKDNPGSVLKAFKTGNREVISRYLMSKADGSIMDEPYGSEKSGRINRVLSAVKLMYDTDNNSFKDEKTKDETFKRWKTNPYTVRNVQNHLGNIYLATADLQDYEDGLREEVTAQMAIPAPTTQRKIDNETVQENQVQTQENPGILSKLTNAVGKYFNKPKETENGTTGNTDVNMQ